MGKAFERGRDSVKRIASNEQRHIEGLAIEGYQRLGGSKEFPKAFQHGPFLCRVAHKELLQDKFTIYEASRTDEESIGAGAA